MSAATTHNFRLAEAIAPATAARADVVRSRQIKRDDDGASGHSHIPALDGVRGLAVLLVLWCHCGAVIERTSIAGAIDRIAFSSARLSTTGVDLFFVLSGFLITGILFDAKGTRHYFRNFYARRTVRIFPLYYACLLIFLVLIPAFAPTIAQALGHPPTGSSWYWLYLSNYSQSIAQYLGKPNEHVLHPTWSLAVEEQFYLVWPAIVCLLDRKQLLRMCGLMIVFSLSLRAMLFCAMGKGAWQILLDFTPCRLDVLATGAAIALIARGPRGVRSLIPPAKIVGPLAAVLLIATIVLMAKLGYRSGMIATPGFAILGSTFSSAIYGALLVAALCATSSGLINRFFSSNLLRTFGKYSYAIYLLHLPVVWFISDRVLAPDSVRIAGTWLPTLILFTAIVSALTMLIALISWNLFERHFLRLKKYFPTR